MNLNFYDINRPPEQMGNFAKLWISWLLQPAQF